MIEPMLLVSFILPFLLLHPSTAAIASKPAVHFSDVQKLKCDALPYRTKYFEANCYFVIDAQDASRAEKQCATVLRGSKIAGNVPDEVWRSLFVNKKEFMVDEWSSRFTKAMCIYESKFRCSTGLSTSVPGKCVHIGGDKKKMTYQKAESYCANVGSLPSSVNDIENRDIAAAGRGPFWLRPSYSKGKWSGKTAYSRFSTCAPAPLYAVAKDEFCDSTVAVVANPDASTRGYWALADQTSELSVMCVGEAESHFWTAPPKVIKKPKPANVNCKEGHEWDEKTGRCDWSGPGEACVKIFNTKNASEFIRIRGYPKIAGIDFDFHSANHSRVFEPFIDKTTRAVVRRGCMATFWSNPQTTAVDAEMKLLKNVEHGEYTIPCWTTGTVLGTAAYGLSRVSCYCDPYETEQETPAKTKCVDNHEWSEEEGKCVWSLDDKYAGSIQTFSDKKMLLEIPNWPLNKRYDTNLRDAKLADFENKVNRIVVRQGCFCTIYSGADLGSWQPRTTINYGSHGCSSRYANKTSSNNQICDSLRIVCECINGDSGNELRIRTPAAPQCIEMHTYDEKTKRCEWTGPARGACHVTNTRNEKLTLNWDRSSGVLAPLGIHRMYKSTVWSRQTTWITVRRGCSCTIWSSYEKNVPYQEYVLLMNIEYGTYRIPQKDFGDVEGGYAELSTAHLSCICDPAQLPSLWTPPPPSTVCLPGHVYDPKTSQCEWTRNKNICGEIRNEAGQSMELIIPNWPTTKHLTWVMPASTEPNVTLFNGRIRQLTVRQHCYIALFTGVTGKEWTTTTYLVGYGTYPVSPRGTRVHCDCQYVV